MPKQRRLWDSSVIIGYLGGQENLAEASENIIERAGHGDIEIVVSAIATIEVAYLEGLDDQDSEAKIRELFNREYIIPAVIDVQVASIARELVRRHKTGPKIRPADAAHLATAILWRIPVVETTDQDLLHLNGLAGNPPLIIRWPLAEGPSRMPGL